MISARRLALMTCLALCALIQGALLATAAFALPPERHYEMVSEPYKAGYGVNEIFGMEPSGEALVYASYGAFAGAPADHIGGAGAGNPYVARREASGWSTSSLTAPASLLPYASPGFADLSADFNESLFIGKAGNNTGFGQNGSTEMKVYRHPTLAPDLAEYFQSVEGSVLTVPSMLALNYYPAASADLSRILVENPQNGQFKLGPEAEGTTAEREQYVLNAKETEPGAFHLLGVDNHRPPRPISSSCSVFLGANVESGDGVSNQTWNVMSADGSEIFFWTCAGSTASDQLFVRLNEERTLEVSRPLGACVSEGKGIPGEVPCRGAANRPPAEFVGASEDGSKVFFATRASLLAESTHESVDLYMADIGCKPADPGCAAAEREVTGLTRVTRPLDSEEGSDVKGVVSTSPDGSHIYFMAGGVLSGTNVEGHVPMKGADNLYMYDSRSGAVVFVSDLCSGAELSGERHDGQCPADLNKPHGTRPSVNDEFSWKKPFMEAQTAGNGRFLLFSSYGRLTSDDADDARDVFRFDAQTGALIRISSGEDGYDTNGNREDEPGQTNADASISSVVVGEASPRREAELNTRAISEDGSRIVFATAEPLSQAATNGLLNAYEWHEDHVALVSTGSDEQPVGQSERITITPSGNDIFFQTVQKLEAQDGDEVADIYDARRGPGFPAVAGGGERCKEDACQGALSAPASLLAPQGTATQVPEEAVVANVGARVPKKAAKARRIHKPKKRRRDRPRSRHGRTHSANGKGGRQ